MIEHILIIPITFFILLILFLPDGLMTKKIKLHSVIVEEHSKSRNPITNSSLLLLSRIGESFRKIVKIPIPKKLSRYYSKLLVKSGEKTISVQNYLDIKTGLSAITFIFLFILYIREINFFSITIIVLLTILVFFAPENILNQRVAKREKEINRNIPNFLSSVSVLTQAGLPVLQAIEEVCKGTKNLLSDMFREAVERVRMGYSFVESFETISETVDSHEIRTLISLITQSHEKGSEGLSIQLKTIAEDSYQTRKLKVQKLANEASSKLFIPMLLLVFPAVMIIIVGPIMFSVMEVFNG